jgi:tetratricopeptide (TPR) repeat protein
LLLQITDVRYCRQAANWALIWGDPALAIEAVVRWKELEKRGGQKGIEPHEAGLYLARAYLAQGEANEAYDVFRNTLKDVGPSSSAGLKLLCAMGNEYLRLRRPILAESTFIEATSYSPTYVPALHGLARAYQQAGKQRAAVEQYQRLLVVDPDNERAQMELARLAGRRTQRSRD